MLQRALVLAVACLTGASQQAHTGSIRGKAADERGGVLPGMTVTVAGPSESKSIATTVSGLYQVSSLPPGTYAVRGALAGFTVRGCDVVVVRDGEVAECNLTACVFWLTCADRESVSSPSRFRTLPGIASISHRSMSSTRRRIRADASSRS